MGVPKTTFRFRDLLEGLAELRKAVIIMFMVYYSKRLEIIKSAKVKGAQGRIQERPGTSFQWSLPVES